jgi:sec-independent protein translocase protein TatA
MFTGGWEWILIIVVALVLFGGGGKIPRLMGDFAKGITSFKKGLKEGAVSDESSDKATIDATAKAEVADAAKKDEPAKT